MRILARHLGLLITCIVANVAIAEEVHKVLLLYGTEFGSAKDFLKKDYSSRGLGTPTALTIEEALKVQGPQTKYDRIIVLAHGAPGRVIHPLANGRGWDNLSSSFVLPFLKNKSELVFHNCLLFETKDDADSFLRPLLQKSGVDELKVSGSADFVASLEMPIEEKQRIHMGLEYLHKLRTFGSEYLSALARVKSSKQSLDSLKKLEKAKSPLLDFFNNDELASRPPGLDKFIEVLLQRIQGQLFYLHSHMNSGSSPFKTTAMAFEREAAELRRKGDLEGLARAIQNMNFPTTVKDEDILNRCAYRLKSFELFPKLNEMKELQVGPGIGAENVLGPGFQHLQLVPPSRESIPKPALSEHPEQKTQ